MTGGVNALRSHNAPPAQNARKQTCAEGHPLVQLGSDPTKRYCPICRMDGRIARGETSGNGHWRDRTHCPAGHPYDEENTYLHLNPDGSVRCRMCRACMRERRRRGHAGPRVTCPACLGSVGLTLGGVQIQRHYAAGTTTWCGGSGTPVGEAAL